MLSKNIQSVVLTTLLLSSASSVFALSGYDYDSYGFAMQRSQQAIQADEPNYARDGKSYYIYGGYYYAHQFLTKTLEDMENVSQNPAVISFPAASGLPDGFHSVEIGFGKEWGRHFDMQLAYFQQFETSKTSNSVVGYASTSVKLEQAKKGVLLAFDYFFNPDDQFQVAAELGAKVADIHQEASFSSAKYKISDSVEVNPLAGMECALYFTHDFAIRMSARYTLSLYRSTSDGQIDGFVGLSYNL